MKMPTTKQVSQENIELLQKFVVSAQEKKQHVPMRHGDIYIKGVCEIALNKKLARAPTWVNTNSEAVALMDKLRVFVSSEDFNANKDASVTLEDRLSREIASLEKKLALKEMTISSLKKELEQMKTSQNHTDTTGRLTERMLFCLPK